MLHVNVLKDHSHQLTKYEGKRAKISIFKLFNDWEKFRLFKNPNFPSLFMNWERLENIHSPRSTFQNPNVESMDELGKLMS